MCLPSCCINVHALNFFRFFGLIQPNTGHESRGGRFCYWSTAATLTVKPLKVSGSRSVWGLREIT